MMNSDGRFISTLDLHYRRSAGRLMSEFYALVRDGKVGANRCAGPCREVYVPPRSVCPKCWAPCGEIFPVADHGTVLGFSIVGARFPGQDVDVPYVFAEIQLDGVDMPLEHMVGIPDADRIVPPPGLEVGARVEAVWVEPSVRQGFLNDDISYFRPSG